MPISLTQPPHSRNIGFKNEFLDRALTNFKNQYDEKTTPLFTVNPIFSLQ